MFHLIEADIDVLNTTCDIITLAGFESLCFSSASAYLEYVSSAAYSPAIAILTCFIMPEIDGYTLVKVVKKKHPQQRAIIITGSPTNGIPADEENLLCLHLSKPYNAKTLMAALKALKLCDDTCGKKREGVAFSPNCKFGLQHACPLFGG